MEQPLFCTYGYNTTVGDNFFMNVYGKLMDSGEAWLRKTFLPTARLWEIRAG